MDQGIVVTIDGPAGAGKSTIARRLAQVLGYRLLDTGALYRAVALLARRAQVAWDDAPAVAEIARHLDVIFQFEGEQNHIVVAGEDVTAAIREPDISSGASQVSALPAVRDGLLELQRQLGRGGGVVVEGRDTGTVVFPDAEAKLFLTASAEVRARRRYDELRARDVSVTFEETLEDMRRRDHRDETRDAAPLTRADDAVVIDSSTLSLDQVVDAMLAVVRDRAGG